MRALLLGVLLLLASTSANAAVCLTYWFTGDDGGLFYRVDTNNQNWGVEADTSPCDVAQITGVTFDEYSTLRNPVFLPLTLDEGAAIGTAIFVAFAVAWGFRQIASVIAEADLGSDNT